MTTDELVRRLNQYAGNTPVEVTLEGVFYTVKDVMVDTTDSSRPVVSIELGQPPAPVG